MHIEVKNTERVSNSDRELEMEIVKSWERSIQKYMSNAKGFVVYVYKTNKSTGFAVQADMLNKDETVNDLTAQMNVEEELSLAGIYSGF